MRLCFSMELCKFNGNDRYFVGSESFFSWKYLLLKGRHNIAAVFMQVPVNILKTDASTNMHLLFKENTRKWHLRNSTPCEENFVTEDVRVSCYPSINYKKSSLCKFCMKKKEAFWKMTYNYFYSFLMCLILPFNRSAEVLEIIQLVFCLFRSHIKDLFFFLFLAFFFLSFPISHL